MPNHVDVLSLHSENYRNVAAPKALGIDYECLYSSDPKPSSHQFCKQNYSGKHFFQSVAATTAGKGQCLAHSGECEIDQTKTLDLFIAGFPCAPFSRFRTTASSRRTRCAFFALAKVIRIPRVAALMPL